MLTEYVVHFLRTVCFCEASRQLLECSGDHYSVLETTTVYWRLLEIQLNICTKTCALALLLNRQAITFCGPRV